MNNARYTITLSAHRAQLSVTPDDDVMLRCTDLRVIP